MTIAYLAPCSSMGGAEWCLIELLGTIRKLAPGWRLHLIGAEHGPLLEMAAALGVEVEVVEFPPELHGYGDSRGGIASAAWRSGGYAVRLRRALDAVRPRILHTNGIKAHLLAAMAAHADTAVIWHVHDYLGARRTASWLAKLASPRCRAAIAVSESVAVDLRRVTGMGEAVRTVWNGVDVERFRPEGEVLDLDAACGLAPAGGQVRVGLVATFAHWKGHRVFLEAAARLASHSHVRFYVAGGPIYRSKGSQHSLEELRSTADLLGLSGRVGFTGHVANPAAAIRALDVVVHASTEPEPFGRVIAEAMACGKPVIAARAGGAAEIASGGGAICHEPGDVAGLASRIAELAGSSDLRAELSVAGRKRALESFDAARAARQVMELYEWAAA